LDIYRHGTLGHQQKPRPDLRSGRCEVDYCEADWVASDDGGLVNHLVDGRV
jgi:hypothetical protein